MSKDKVTQSCPAMHRVLHNNLDQRATSLIALATHGQDDELLRALRVVQPEVLKTMATYVNKDGNTLLHVTAVKERMESLMALVKLSLDINSKNGSGRSSLFKCINHNTLNSARLLLQAGADVNEIVCRQTGETLLHWMVKSNRLKAMELLLEMGADTEVKTRDGETPLHFATRFNRLVPAQMLVQAGADVNATNKDGETALHVAIATKAYDLAKMLIHHKKCNMALKDRRGMTPLHAAVAGGCLDLVKMMLSSNSAAINSKESLLGRTPLLLACSTGTQKMASLLLSHGADANLTTNYRKSVLHVAASNGNVGALGAVIKFASNPNALSINNMTPLHYAVKGGYCDIVKILLKSGVNANLRDIEGYTSLHMASIAGDNDIVLALLHHQVQVNATNMEQQTALHLALTHGHKDTGSILLKHGSDPTLLDIYDKTAMDYWEEMGTEDKPSSSDSKETDHSPTDNLFSSTNEEDDRVRQIRFDDTATRIYENNLIDNEDRLDEYINRVGNSQTDPSLNHVSNNNIIGRKETQTSGYLSDLSRMNGNLNGDISTMNFSDENNEDDNEIDSDDIDMICLQNKIGDVIIDENVHEFDDEDTEIQIQTDIKHKKHPVSSHRRVRKTSTGKSKKPSTTKESKSRSSSKKTSNENKPQYHGHGGIDCQRKRKVGTTTIQ